MTQRSFEQRFASPTAQSRTSRSAFMGSGFHRVLLLVSTLYTKGFPVVSELWASGHGLSRSCSGSRWMRWRSCQSLRRWSSAPPWPWPRSRWSHATATVTNWRKGAVAARKTKKTWSGSQRADTSSRSQVALWRSEPSLRAGSGALPKPLRLDVVIVRLDGSLPRCAHAACFVTSLQMWAPAAQGRSL